MYTEEPFVYYLNTVRHLQSPPDDKRVDELVAMLSEGIASSAGTLSGIRSIQWILSQDRMTMQAFSGWSSWDELPMAEHSEMHVRNSRTINDFMGGLHSPQEHHYYRVIGQRSFE